MVICGWELDLMFDKLVSDLWVEVHEHIHLRRRPPPRRLDP